jgi:hypothetical protein
MSGLDNVKAFGLDAFDKVIQIIENLTSLHNLSKEMSKKLKDVTLSSLNYLKYKYRKNLKQTSTCADHCVNFALSEKFCKKSNDENQLSIQCDHEHFRDCKDCIALHYLFEDIFESVNLLVKDETIKKKKLHSLDKCKEKIFDWKSHIIRSFNQDVPKYRMYKCINDSIDQSELTDYLEVCKNSKKTHPCKLVGVTFDWAMKYNPTKFRESQGEWFGKAGLSYHVASLVFKENCQLQSLTLVHLFETVSQDSDCVIGIMDSVFKFIKERFCNAKIFLRSDNAGCYHNQDFLVIVSLFACKHDLTLLRYDFSEAQNGKCICDRKISAIRREFVQFVNRGNDITNTKQMKDAILQSKSLRGVIVFCCEMNASLSFKKYVQLPGISNFHSIEYHGEKIKLNKYFGIGNGKIFFI